jgi:hypothetical protein
LDVIIISSIPALVSGLVLWYIKRLFDKRDARDKAAEEARVNNNILLLRGVSASLLLGNATAEAIEKQVWNGDLRDAKEQAQRVKHEIDNFTIEQSCRRY